MQYVIITILLIKTLFIIIISTPILIKFTSCFIIQSSKRISNHFSLLGNSSHSYSKFQNNDFILKNSKLLDYNERFIAKLTDSDVKPTLRPLNHYERKEILNKILYDKDEALIKDLISKADPKDLVRRKQTKLKDKKSVVKDEDLIRAVSLEEESELVEDTGSEEPTQINHVRAGNIVFHRGEVYTIVSIQHIAQARSKGHYKAKMQLLHTSKENSFSFPDGCKMVVINPKKVSCEYTHIDDSTDSYVFKTDKSEIKVPKNTNIGSLKYLKPGLMVSISRWRDKILNVFIPFHIEYKVVDLNTGNYAATLDNGLVVLVPTYIKVGDHIEVTTRACEFLRRTKIA